MIVARGFVVALIVGLVGLRACSAPPSQSDQYVSTLEGSPVSFTARAQDLDLDPLHPEAHPLSFLLVDGPTHGTVLGDLEKVRYEEPNTGFVELSYVPAVGFTGTDMLVVAARDPMGASTQALAMIQIDVEAPPLVEVLSGSWAMSISVNVQSQSITAVRSKLTEVYRVGPFSLQGVAEWRYASASGTPLQFDALSFNLGLSLGGFATFESTLALDPKEAAPFRHWQIVSRFGLGGFSLVHTLRFDKLDVNSHQSLVARGSLDFGSVTSTTTFAMPDGCCSFDSEEIRLSFAWCDSRWASTLEVTAAGFQEWTLSVQDYAIPGLAGPSFGLYLDATVSFKPAAKTLTPTLKLNSAGGNCIELLADLASSGPPSTMVSGLRLYGLKFRCVLPGQVTLQDSTSLLPGKNSAVTGYNDYFELLQISGPTSSWCGTPGLWRIATYFESGGPFLFDWGMTRASFDISLGSHFRALAELVFRSGHLTGDPIVEVTFGSVFRW